MKKPPKRKPKRKHGHGQSVAAPRLARGTASAGAADRPEGRATARLGTRPADGRTATAASARSAAIASLRAWLPAAPASDLSLPLRRARAADQRQRHGAAPVARAAVYAPDERQAMLLLLLPFLLMAAAIGINQSVRYAVNLPDIAATRPTEPARLPSGERLATAIRALPRSHISPSAAPHPITTEPGPATPADSRPIAPPLVAAEPPRLAASDVAAPLPGVAPVTATTITAPEALAPPLAAVAPRAPVVTAAPADRIVVAALPPPPPMTERGSASSADITASEPAPSQSLTGGDGHPATRLTALPPAALPPLTGIEQPADLALLGPSRRAAFNPPGETCPAGSWGLRTASLTTVPPAPGTPSPARDADAFGRALAAAARAQIGELVVYTDSYRRISYPMGDVAPLYGVCTDVVIRAYRTLGLDLQALVHGSGIGSGDTSIDHRRVETLRRFFAAYGTSLPVTDFAEDYHPGDIVSYYRPQNAHSKTHIALVSDVVGPSGHLMIVHNRGWGPQLEDALFVDEITGHYRYSGAGATATPSVIAAPARPSRTATSKAERPKARTPATATEPPAPPSRRREAHSSGIVVAR